MVYSNRIVSGMHAKVNKAVCSLNLFYIFKKYELYCIAGCVAVGKFGESSLFCQILPYNWYPNGRNLFIGQTFFTSYFEFGNSPNIDLPLHSMCCV